MRQPTTNVGLGFLKLGARSCVSSSARASFAPASLSSSRVMSDVTRKLEFWRCCIKGGHFWVRDVEFNVYGLLNLHLFARNRPANI